MTDIRRLQSVLLSRGYSIGIADGIAGRRTYAALLAHVSGRRMDGLLELGAGCAAHLPGHGIADTPARLANFLGQAAHESGGFQFMREIWGPTPAQRRYEGRRDLGNTQPGDGKRFMGRGIFQLTGRANYAEMAVRTGLPLVDQPELAERPDTAVLTACIFWQTRGLSALADAGQEDTITRRINGGTNGIADRRRLVGIAKGMLA
jgi:putative chitinase